MARKTNDQSLQIPCVLFRHISEEVLETIHGAIIARHEHPAEPKQDVQFEKLQLLHKPQSIFLRLLLKILKARVVQDNVEELGRD